MYAILFLLISLGALSKSESPRWDLMRQNDYVINVHHIEIEWYNKSYMEIEKFEMVKYNRSFRRVFNASGYLYKELGTDFKVNVQLYKLLSNRYKFFPFTATLQVCQEYERNTFRMKEIMASSTNLHICPQKPGYLYAIHLKIDHTRLPPLIPSGDFKISCDFYIGKDRLFQVNGYGSISYKNKLRPE